MKMSLNKILGDHIYVNKKTAVCLIGSAGRFEGDKAVSKI
jgi:hypothetical protein